jgi:hypothetical protein
LAGGALAGARAGEWEEVSSAGAEEEVGSAVADGGLIPMLMVWALTWRGCLMGLVFTPRRGCLMAQGCTPRREHPTTRPIAGIRRGRLGFAWAV